MFKSEKERAREGKTAGVNYTPCKDLSGVSMRFSDSPTPAFLPFIPAALSAALPSIAWVSSWRLNISTVRNSHAATLPRMRATTDAWTRNAWNEIRSRTDREVRGEVVRRSTMKKNLGGWRSWRDGGFGRDALILASYDGGKPTPGFRNIRAGNLRNIFDPQDKQSLPRHEIADRC